MDVHTVVLNFRDLLVRAYPNWRCGADEALHHDRGYLDEAFGDWAQANWELLVERVLCHPKQFLNIYGSGSDYELAAHSRVFFHDATPTHKVICRSTGVSHDLLSDSDIELDDWAFDKFVCFTNNWFDESPPFDHALLSGRKSNDPAVIQITNILFGIREMATT